MKNPMSLKAKIILATAALSIGLFVNAAPLWAEPQPLTIPSNGIVLQGKAKEKYVADTMHKLFSQMKAQPPAPFEAPLGWKMETKEVNGITLERLTAENKKSDRVLLQTCFCYCVTDLRIPKNAALPATSRYDFHL